MSNIKNIKNIKFFSGFLFKNLTLDSASFRPATANKTTLIGWSLGGLHAIEYAYQNPNKIEKIILINSLPRFSEDPEDLSWPGISSSEQAQFYQLIKLPESKFKKRFLSLITYPEPSSNYPMLEKYLENLSPENIKNLDYLFNTDLREKYKKLDLPLVHIFGDQDAIVKYKKNTEEKIRALNPRAEIKLIKEAGHIPFISHPEDFLWAQ